MTICPICHRPGQPTEEHIFQSAIGGSVVLPDLCKNCNDYLGQAVDCKLTDHFLIVVKRFMLGVRNRYGKLPNPLAGTYPDMTGQKTTLETDSKGNPLGFRFLPQIGQEIDGKLEIKIDSKDSAKLLDIVKKQYTRRGLPVPSDDELLGLVEKVSESVGVHRKIDIDLIEYKRGVLKIAYELGLRWLGLDYRFDSTARKMRKCLFDKRTLAEIGSEYEMPGYIELGPIPSMDAWDEPWKDFAHLHLAMIFSNQEGVFCALRIFDVIYAHLRISTKPHRSVVCPKLLILDSQQETFEEHHGSLEVERAIASAAKYASKPLIGLEP
jgi:hypothetical protein